jgi:ankyrin repeat protein
LCRDGDTALHIAAIQNGVELAKVLLEKGADINAEADG